MKPFLYSYGFSVFFLIFVNFYHFLIFEKSVVFVFILSNLILISILKTKFYLNAVLLNFFTAAAVLLIADYNYQSLYESYSIISGVNETLNLPSLYQIVFFTLAGLLVCLIAKNIKEKVLSDTPPSGIIDELKLKMNKFIPKLFSRLKKEDKKINIEIGAGKGHFLQKIALLRKEEFFIGIEIKTKNIVKAAQKIKKLDNALLLRADINSVYNFFDENSVSAFYINHPDPWSKNRKLKTRILTPPFLSALSQKLQKGGKIYITTDFLEYIESSYAMLLKIPELKDEISGIKTELDGYPLGLYSQKKLQENQKVYYIVFTRAD